MKVRVSPVSCHHARICDEHLAPLCSLQTDGWAIRCCIICRCTLLHFYMYACMLYVVFSRVFVLIVGVRSCSSGVASRFASPGFAHSKLEIRLLGLIGPLFFCVWCHYPCHPGATGHSPAAPEYRWGSRS